MASSGKGTNGPIDAEDDKFEELLAGPGCCSGWQGQAKNKLEKCTIVCMPSPTI